MFRNFDEILELVKNDTQKTIAVAMAEDADVLKALEKARSMGLAKAFLTGNAEKIYELMSTHGIDKNNYEVINSISEIESIESAVAQVKSGKAQVLMKGLCSTSVFLKGVLDKNNGLRSGKVLSHLAVFESPQYHKLFMLSDAAMNIAPDFVGALRTSPFSFSNRTQKEKSSRLFGNPAICIRDSCFLVMLGVTTRLARLS